MRKRKISQLLEEARPTRKAQSKKKKKKKEILSRGRKQPPTQIHTHRDHPFVNQYLCQTDRPHITYLAQECGRDSISASVPCHSNSKSSYASDRKQRLKGKPSNVPGVPVILTYLEIAVGNTLRNRNGSERP